jgi:hypothetical protein
MSEIDANDRKLRLIVPTQSGGEEEGEVREAAPEWVEKIFARSKEVSLDRVQKELQEVRAQVGALLSVFGQPGDADAGFALAEIEVSLALSAQGSIGVATTGMEAVISLTYTSQQSHR